MKKAILIAYLIKIYDCRRAEDLIGWNPLGPGKIGRDVAEP